MSQTPESASQSETVFPIVECPVGPHDVLPAFVTNEIRMDQEKDPVAHVSMAVCPTHRIILNMNGRVAIKEWLSENELKERGYVRLV